MDRFTDSIADILVVPPEDIVFFAGKLLLLIGIVFLALLLLRLLNALLKKLVDGQLPLFRMLYSGVRWLIIIGAALLILQQFGVKINSLWTLASTLLAMVAIGFVALWSVLSNLLCTLMLIIMRPFRIGDEIEIIDPAMTQGLGGRVRNINLIFTVLDAPQSEGREATTLQVPNNLFFQKILRRQKGRRTHGLDKQIFEEQSLLRPDTPSGNGNPPTAP